MSRTDEDLFSLSKRGDPDAFPEIYERHKGKVFRYAYGITGDHHQAQDVTQETFLKLFRAQHRYRDGSNVVALLLRIAHNTALHHVAKRRRRPTPLSHLGRRRPAEQPDPSEDAVDTRPVPSDSSQARELQAELAAALEALPERLRKVYLLHEIEDHSYAEIAEMLHLSYYAVHKRFARAVDRLGASLRRYLVQR